MIVTTTVGAAVVGVATAGVAAVGATAVAAAAGSPAITTTLMPAIDVGALIIGREEWERDYSGNVTMEDDDDANVEAGEYVHNFLEVALSQLWEGCFGRRMTMAKTMETSRDHKHKEKRMLLVYSYVIGRRQ